MTEDKKSKVAQIEVKIDLNSDKFLKYNYALYEDIDINLIFILKCFKGINSLLESDRVKSEYTLMLLTKNNAEVDLRTLSKEEIKAQLQSSSKRFVLHKYIPEVQVKEDIVDMRVLEEDKVEKSMSEMQLAKKSQMMDMRGKTQLKSTGQKKREEKVEIKSEVVIGKAEKNAMTSNSKSLASVLINKDPDAIYKQDYLIQPKNTAKVGASPSKVGTTPRKPEVKRIVNDSSSSSSEESKSSGRDTYSRSSDSLIPKTQQHNNRGKV